MVDELIVSRLKENLGQKIVFWNAKGLRFEGVLLEVSGLYFCYYDSHKLEKRLMRIELLAELEVKRD